MPALSPVPPWSWRLSVSPLQRINLWGREGAVQSKKRMWVYNCFSTRSLHFISFYIILISRGNGYCKFLSFVRAGSGRFYRVNLITLDFPHCCFRIQLFLRSTESCPTHPSAFQLPSFVAIFFSPIIFVLLGFWQRTKQNKINSPPNPLFLCRGI